MADSNRDKKRCVLLVDDEPDILELLELALLKMGLEVDKAADVGGARKKLDTRNYDLCLTDMRMPDGDGLQVVQHIAKNEMNIPIAVITAHGNAENAVMALKAGAFDYLSKPVALDQLRALVKSVLHLPSPDSGKDEDDDKILLGHSASMQKVRDLIKRVARSEAPVHVTGESGSGKELAARLIVKNGSRYDKPFVAVNCGAIPVNLMESEFFGYQKGAFTGADKDRQGFFQAANGGTLFLDEVADLPLEMQVKLLRAIQEKQVRKLGANNEESVDVRIISATHLDLAERVRKGEFRQDLYYRLSVIPISMPALRESREDIPEIAKRILARLNGNVNVRFSEKAMKVMQGYSFPGNVRELENIIERALALCNGDVIEEQDMLLVPVESIQSESSDFGNKHPLPEYLDRVEKQALLEALDQTSFNRTAAAKLLGLSFRTMRYRMERLGIKAPGNDDHEG